MITTAHLETESDLKKAIQAFQILRNLSEEDLETLEMMSDKNIDILTSINESKQDKVHPIESILE